jgi:hypothetical protein
MLVFRAEIWAWAKTDISRPTPTGMRLLRSVQGKSKGERLRNKKVGKSFKINILECKLINNNVLRTKIDCQTRP